MLVPSDEMMLEQIEAFLAQTGVSATRFGLDAVSDGALVGQLRRQERSLTLRTAAKIVRHIASFAPRDPAHLDVADSC